MVDFSQLIRYGLNVFLILLGTMLLGGLFENLPLIGSFLSFTLLQISFGKIVAGTLTLFLAESIWEKYLRRFL